MARLLSIHFHQALKEENRTIKDIHHAFRRVIDLKTETSNEADKRQPEQKYELQRESTITNISEELWNSMLGNDTSFDWKALRSLEQAFSKTKKSHEKWKFNYYIVRDNHGKPLLATYFTLCLTKDDALAPASVSYKIESERVSSPSYLSSKTLMMGCPLSIGKHLHLDTSSKDWQEILMFFLDNLWKDQDELKANILNLRDFYSHHKEIKQFFVDQGFIKIEMLDNHIIENMNKFMAPEEYLDQLKSSQKYSLGKER